jgi:hypothetical protein
LYPEQTGITSQVTGFVDTIRPARIQPIISGLLLCAALLTGIRVQTCCSQPAALSPGLRVLEQNDQSLLIEFVPDIRRESQQVNSRMYTTVTFEGAEFSAMPGQPLIPERSVLIGLPPNTRPVVSLVDVREGESFSGRLLPAPDANHDNEVAVESYSENADAYNEGQSQPTRQVRVNSTGRFRQQEVASIIFSPVQYSAASDRFRVSDRLVARVDFQPANLARPAVGFARPDPHFDTVYQSLLNTGQAAGWRVGTTTGALRKPAQLATGDWYQIDVADEGMVRLTREMLADAGVPVDGVAPRSIRMFNNGGQAVPSQIYADRPEGLTEIPILVAGETDGQFDDNDAVMFYGHPTAQWTQFTTGAFEHTLHPYQDNNIYWLTYGGGSGLRMQSRQAVNPAGAATPQTFSARVFREVEKEKLHPSGLAWYWEQLFDGESRILTADLPGYVAGSPVTYRMRLKGGSNGSHQISVSEGNFQIFSQPFTSYNEVTMSGLHAVSITGGRSQLEFQYTTTAQAGRAYVDWIEYTYDRAFSADDSRLFFESPNTTGPIAYVIQNLDGSDVRVFDVTNPQNPMVISGHTQSGGATRFADAAVGSSIRQYWACAEGAMNQPGEIRKAENSDLRAGNHNADLIIITHEDFQSAAQSLQAHRQNLSNMAVEVVTIASIYNEFSGGLMDAVAIRDFLKHAFENWNISLDRPPSYVLLMGDGDYDFRNIISDEDKNWIPPYQIDHDSDILTRCTDDYYTYVSGNDALMDMAVGRIPVRTSTEAAQYVNKLIRYETQPEFGNWKSTMTFAADDELTPGDNTQRIHTDQSETIALASYLPPYLQPRKIYLMDYPEERLASVTGVRKPGAETDLIAGINRGSAMISYFGHGNHRLLAHEQLLNQDVDLDKIQNGRRLFFFYPATCAFGRFDLPQAEGMSEDLIAANNRGAIATLNSVRDVFSRQNFSLADKFYQHLFSETPTARLGAAVVAAKNQVSVNVVNNEKFHLFGDPTLRLALPMQQADAVALSTDSLTALSQAQVTGNVQRDGALWTDFNGSVQVEVYDDQRTGVRVMENGERVTYQLPGRSIFRGASNVTASQAGQFSVGFIVPKDITYGGENGRIGVYYSGAGIDGAGTLNKVAIGGTANAADDQDGPMMELSLDGLGLGETDFVGETPVLLADIEDTGGINITGEIGHKIDLTIDDVESDRVDVTERFSYHPDSFTAGQLQYPLEDLEPGLHKVALKAWDSYNNSSVTTLEFSVSEDANLAIRDLYNYPNPFDRGTQFTFSVNRPSEVMIKIYTVAGRLVHRFDDIRMDLAGTYVSPLWNGRDADNERMANGVYLYKVVARSQVGAEAVNAEKIGKLVIAR